MSGQNGKGRAAGTGKCAHAGSDRERGGNSDIHRDSMKVAVAATDIGSVKAVDIPRGSGCALAVP